MLRWRVWNLPLLRVTFIPFMVLRLRRGPPRAGVTRDAAGRPRATMKFGHRFQQAIEATHPSVSDQVRPRAPDHLSAAPFARVCAPTEGHAVFRRRAARQGRRRRLPPRSRRPPRASSPSTRGFPASRGVDASEPRSRAPRGPAFMRLQTPLLLFASTHPAPPPSSRRSSCATRRSRNA